MQEVRIRLGKAYVQNVGWSYTPTTVASAQLNLHYIAMLMILENDVFVPQFTEDNIHAPHVLEMIARVKITHELAMDGMEAGEGNPAEIVLKDGTTRVGWGRVEASAKRPSIHADVVEKFRKMTRERLSIAEQDALIALCDRMETLGDASELVARLAGERT